MKTLITVLFMLLVPLAALADVAPGDDDNNNDNDNNNNNDDNGADDDSTVAAYTCNDICGLVETCQSSCVTGECASFCLNELTVGDLACAAQTECAAFNSCLCKEGVGGDNQADDDEDDDDDSGGCSVSDRPSNLLLVVVMLTIGAFALGYSLRTTGPKANRR